MNQNGGTGQPVQTGVIPRGPIVRSKEKKIILWYMFPGMTQMHMRSGRVSVCLLRLSGNMQHAVI